MHSPSATTTVQGILRNALQKVHEPERVVEGFLQNLLKNVDEEIGGEFHVSSECEVIPLNEEPEDGLPKPDRRLVNWRRWLAIRERDCRKIQRSTHRSRKEMLMAANPNTLREILRRKKTLDKTTAQPGELNFWKLPPKTRQGLHATLPKSERMLCAPETVYTQTPDLLLMEQSIVKSQAVDPVVKFFREKCEEEAKSFEPDLDLLILMGNYKEYKRQPKKPPSFQLSHKPSKKVQERKQSIKIAGIQVTSDFPDVNVLVDLTFECFKSETQIQQLEIENFGEIATNLTFKESFPNEAVPMLAQSDSFCFIDSTFRIIPGEVIKIEFHFHPTQLGLFRKSLVMQVDPEFSQECHICVDLLGVCQKKFKIDEKLAEIESEVMKQAAELEVNEIIKEMTQNSSGQLQPLQKKLFRDDDQKNFSRVNPRLFFDLDCVENLSRMHRELTASDDKWDFDTESLYKRILEISDLDQQRLVYEVFSQNLNQMRRPRLEVVGDEEKSTKFALARNVFAAFVDKFEEAAGDGRERWDLESSVKSDFSAAINKMISILEA